VPDSNIAGGTSLYSGVSLVATIKNDASPHCSDRHGMNFAEIDARCGK
jgi:hypothetical protein